MLCSSTSIQTDRRENKNNKVVDDLSNTKVWLDHEGARMLE